MRIFFGLIFVFVASLAHAETVKVATVNFAPTLGDIDANRNAIVALTEEAAHNDAKIVVHTEMATSGYSFFSREQIAKAAEQIPGPTTAAIGAVAAEHEIYVAFGMPEFDPVLGSYFNSAVLIGPDGKIVGVYRKRNNLLEAAYNSQESGPVPVFDTPYGRIGIVICADMFYPHFPRAAAIAGADILLAPANVGISVDFMKVLTFENDFAMVVANRFGAGLQGENVDAFTQDTFTIALPFPYDFSYDSRSVIMTAGGEVLAEIDKDANEIGYAELPIGDPQSFPVVRKPQMYGLIGQDTLESYTFTQFGMPEANKFVVAALDPGPSAKPVEAALDALRTAVGEANAFDTSLRLAVMPEGYFSSLTEAELSALKEFSAKFKVDLYINLRTGNEAPVSKLLTYEGEVYDYPRTHRRRNSPIPDAALSDKYWVIDRDYARVGLSQGVDMLVPETALVLAKMGVDVVAVNADDDSKILAELWKTRTANFIHVVVANRSGSEGIFLGGYKSNPSVFVGSGSVLHEVNTEDVRSKKWPRFFDYRSIVRRCADSNC